MGKVERPRQQSSSRSFKKGECRGIFNTSDENVAHPMVLHIQATFRPILNVCMADDGNFIAPIEDALKIFEYSIPHLLNIPTY